MKKLALIASLFVVCSCTPRSAEVKPYPEDSRRARLGIGGLPTPPSLQELATGETAPPTMDEAGGEVQSFGERWLFGHGMGRTMTTVGTAVIFPPYLLYVAGNAALSLAGYEPVYLTDALPDRAQEGVLFVYDEFTSVPGRVTSYFAGREFAEPMRRDAG